MGGFRAPSEAEIEEILYWLKRERVSNIRFSLICVSVLVVATLAILICGLFRRPLLLVAALMGTFEIPGIFFVIKNILTENEKIEIVKRGEAMIAEPRIRKVGIKYLGQHVRHRVVSADFREGPMVRSLDFVISGRINKQMKKEPKGFVVKFSNSGNRWLNRQYVFVPNSH
ncbi:MAG: hypothetical protein IKX10_04820 [Lachnospiraceae bacterium]|nr:hypothetical protein [Lachnospiraceae bacterium]